jgi:hypothetical protein
MTIGQAPAESFSDIAAASAFVSQAQWNVSTFAGKVQSVCLDAFYASVEQLLDLLAPLPGDRSHTFDGGGSAKSLGR